MNTNDVVGYAQFTPIYTNDSINNQIYECLINFTESNKK